VKLLPKWGLNVPKNYKFNLLAHFVDTVILGPYSIILIVLKLELTVQSLLGVKVEVNKIIQANEISESLRLYHD